MAKKQALRPAADPHHEGNSAAYHTGKPCIVKGCTEPAGTWWGPSWCMRHNDERLERISAALDNAEMTMRLRSMVNDATLDVRRYCAELIRQRDAAASIAWRRITKDDLVPHKEVLVTRGAGWTVRLLCWRSARPQRHNPALNYLEGWWEPGGCRVMDTDEPQWIAEIPPAPSVPTIGAADQAPRAPGAPSVFRLDLGAHFVQRDRLLTKRFHGGARVVAFLAHEELTLRDHRLVVEFAHTKLTPHRPLLSNT